MKKEQCGGQKKKIGMFSPACSFDIFWFWLCSEKGMKIGERTLSGKEKIKGMVQEFVTTQKGGTTKDLPEYYFSLLCSPLQSCKGPSCNQEKIRVVAVLNNALLLKHL